MRQTTKRRTPKRERIITEWLKTGLLDGVEEKKVALQLHDSCSGDKQPSAAINLARWTIAAHRDKEDAKTKSLLREIIEPGLRSARDR